ncbi:MAG: GNAT family N-acetyltransferase [Clostridiales bacterium]|nr:GNAT family N-acetyltransferase [Clostridiales bacterium]
MIVNYSPEYKEAVSKLISERCKRSVSYEMYLFDTFGEMFGKSSFIFIKGGTAAGFIGIIASADQKSLYVYSLCVNQFYKRSTISNLLIERAVIYANKNNFNTISFPVNPTNYKNYDLFSRIAKRLNKQMTRAETDYKEDTFVETVYTIHLNKPAEASKL